jgi:hypothetical protein
MTAFPLIMDLHLIRKEIRNLEKYFSSLLQQSHLHVEVTYFSEYKGLEQTEEKTVTYCEEGKEEKGNVSNYYLYHYLEIGKKEED